MRAWLAACVLILAGAASATAWAQKQVSTLPSTSRSTFLKLTEVQELWEQEDYATAIAELEALAAKVRDNDYEYALTNQYLANTSILAGDQERAKAAIEVALSTEDIPPPMKADLDLFSIVLNISSVSDPISTCSTGSYWSATGNTRGRASISRTGSRFRVHCRRCPGSFSTSPTQTT